MLKLFKVKKYAKMPKSHIGVQGVHGVPGVQVSTNRV